jgi:hypothetical protein
MYCTIIDRKRLTSMGSSSYTALSMSFTNSSCPSGAHVTDFFFLSNLAPTATAGDTASVLLDVPEAVGDGLRALAISFRASWNASVDDGCATFAGGSFFAVVGAVTPAGAFLKLGSFGFCLGAEKKDESDFDSFIVVVVIVIAAAATAVVVDGLPSFLTTTEGRNDDVTDTALFFAGGPGLDKASGSLRFFCFASIWGSQIKERYLPMDQ